MSHLPASRGRAHAPPRPARGLAAVHLEIRLLLSDSKVTSTYLVGSPFFGSTLWGDGEKKTAVSPQVRAAGEHKPATCCWLDPPFRILRFVLRVNMML